MLPDPISQTPEPDPNQETESATPETDAEVARLNSNGDSFADSHRELAGLARRLERERNLARLPICVGRPIIEILAKEGMWTSSNGNAVVAADCLYRNNPYAFTGLRDALRQAIGDYMSQFGQGLEAHGIMMGPAQIEADKNLRAVLEGLDAAAAKALTKPATPDPIVAERDALKAALQALRHYYRQWSIPGTLYNQVEAALQLSTSTVPGSWVIEDGSGVLHGEDRTYLGLSGGVFDWFEEKERAIQFRRKQDAEAFIDHKYLTGTSAVAKPYEP